MCEQRKWESCLVQALPFLAAGLSAPLAAAAGAAAGAGAAAPAPKFVIKSWTLTLSKALANKPIQRKKEEVRKPWN